MQSRCILVLGMHRGGTSAFAGTLQALGVDFGADLLPGQVENPLGFFEDRTVVRVNDDILAAVGSFWCDPLPDLDASAWERNTRKLLDEAASKLGAGFGHASLWGLKDPRLCRLLPLWLPLLTRLGSTPCFVVAVRRPTEVVASLVARNRMEPKNAQLLWLEHLLAAEADTRGLPRVFVTYDGLMNDWRGTVAGIASALELDWPRSPGEPAVADQVDQFLRPALRHHHHDGRVGTLRVAHDVHELFCRLAALPARSAEAGPILAALDEHRRLAREWSWQHTEENVRLRRERHQAQTIIESYEADLKGLRADRAAVVADRAKAQEVIDSYGRELSQRRNDIEAVLADRRQAQAVIDENQAELIRLRSDRAALVADRAKAQTIIESYEADLKGLRADRAALVADRAQAQVIIESYEADLKGLRADRAAVVADRAKAQEVIESYEADLKGLRADRAAVVADRARAQTIIEEQGAEIKRLREERELIVADRRRAQELIEACEITIRDLRSEREALAADRRQAQEVLEGYDAALKASRADWERLAADHRQTQQTLAAQAAKIEAMHREYEALRQDHVQAKAVTETQAGQLKILHEEARIMRESPRHALAVAFRATRRYLGLKNTRRT